MASRHVYPTHEIPHLWVHRKQQEARNPTRNLYFEGDTIYSYGPHFPIAKLMRRKGREAVLFTIRDFSNTTAKHKHCVLSACTHMRVFYVSEFGTHTQVRSQYKRRCNETLKLIVERPDSLHNLVDTLDRLISEANAYAEFFRLKWRFTHPENWAELRAQAAITYEKRRSIAQKRAATLRKKKQEEAEKRAREFEAVLPEWEDGHHGLTNSFHEQPIHMRISPKDSRLVETTRGATVSKRFVEILWTWIQKAREQGSEILNPPIEVKPNSLARYGYHVNSIEADGSLRIGCHHILWPQIERFARKLGWLE